MYNKHLKLKHYSYSEDIKFKQNINEKKKRTPIKLTLPPERKASVFSSNFHCTKAAVALQVRVTLELTSAYIEFPSSIVTPVVLKQMSQNSYSVT